MNNTVNIAIYFYNGRPSFLHKQKQMVNEFLLPYNLSNFIISQIIDTTSSKKLMLKALINRANKFDCIIICSSQIINLDYRQYVLSRNLIERSDCSLINIQSTADRNIFSKKIAGH